MISDRSILITLNQEKGIETNASEAIIDNEIRKWHRSIIPPEKLANKGKVIKEIIPSGRTTHPITGMKKKLEMS